MNNGNGDMMIDQTATTIAALKLTAEKKSKTFDQILIVWSVVLA